MKFYLLLGLITAIILVIVPAAALSDKNETSVTETEKASVTEAFVPENDSISVFLTETQTVITVDRTEYLIGAVACEMPMTFHKEALKAQAVACNTYSRYLANNPDSSIFGADISDSSKKHQGYISKEERKLKWGENFESYEKKLRSIVEDTENIILTYNDEPIIATFFSICPGQTENASDIFKSDIPYLKSVKSDGDKLSPDYTKSVYFTKDEFLEGIKKAVGSDINYDTDELIGEAVVTDAGTVKSIEICGKTLSGEEIRNALSLRSSAFSITQSDDGFTVKTTGYGHFVGMSQYGADYMARQGSDFKDILMHYYTGVKISDV